MTIPLNPTGSQKNLFRLAAGLIHAAQTGMFFTLLAIAFYHYGWDFVPWLIGFHMSRSYFIGWSYEDRKQKAAK